MITLDTSPPLDAATSTWIPEIMGVFLCYARAIDNTMLVALGTIAYCICILTDPPVLPNGMFNQCLPEGTSIGQIQHPKGCCMELGNWPIKVQLRSTNSKGLPVLFQGSHQGLLLNNHHLT